MSHTFFSAAIVLIALSNGQPAAFASQVKTGIEQGVTSKLFPNGSFYEGEWLNQNPHGTGTLVQADGTRYAGQFKNGEPSGKGVMIWANGDSYEGEWEKGNPQGMGTKRFHDHSIYEGQFKEGIQHGQGKYTYPDGTEYQGKWLAGKPEGKGKLTFITGGSYSGHFKQGVPHGTGKFIYANGDTYEGLWQQGKQSGKGRFNYAVGGYYEGEFKNGQRHGTGLLVTGLGQRYQGGFKLNEKEGDGICSEGRKVFECSFKHGEPVALNPATPNNAQLTAQAGKKRLKPVQQTIKEAVNSPEAFIKISASAEKSIKHISKVNITDTAFPIASIDTSTHLPKNPELDTLTLQVLDLEAATPDASKSLSTAAPSMRIAAELPVQPHNTISASLPIAKPIATPLITSQQQSNIEDQSQLPQGHLANTRDEFAQAIEHEIKAMQPNYTLKDIAEGRTDVLFNHDIDGFDIAKTHDKSWWKKQSALFSSSVSIESHHGSVKLHINIRDYDGPGTYRLSSNSVTLTINNQTYVCDETKKNTINIIKESDALLEGTFELVLQEKGKRQGEAKHLENGVFRLSQQYRNY